MPVAGSRVADDEAEPFEALEVFGNGVEFFLCGAACELGAIWGALHSPGVGAIAIQGNEPLEDLFVGNGLGLAVDI